MSGDLKGIALKTNKSLKCCMGSFCLNGMPRTLRNEVSKEALAWYAGAGQSGVCSQGRLATCCYRSNLPSHAHDCHMSARQTSRLVRTNIWRKFIHTCHPLYQSEPHILGSLADVFKPYPVLSNLLGGAVRLAARKVLAKEPLCAGSGYKRDSKSNIMLHGRPPPIVIASDRLKCPPRGAPERL
eukprot:5435188-Amphidinium_carterae.2